GPVPFGTGAPEIDVMSADGTGERRVIDQGSTPTWSPDGNKIAFVSYLDGNGEIYVVNTDGSQVTRLTNNTDADTEPAWSPDGKTIAFAVLDGAAPGVYTMAADGTNRTQLTSGATSDQSPSWSPDGHHIAFATDRYGGNLQIDVMKANGTARTRLTSDKAFDTRPAWSPDGQKIAFVTDRDGGSSIYLMNTDGTGQRRLVADADEPDWQPPSRSK